MLFHQMFFFVMIQQLRVSEAQWLEFALSPKHVIKES